MHWRKCNTYTRKRWTLLSTRKKLDLIDPLDMTQNDKTLVNIVTGKIADYKIDVNDAVDIGKRQMIEFESGLPESFNTS